MATTATPPNDRLLDALRDELSRHPAELTERVLRAVIETDSVPDNLDATIWGPTPSIEDVAAAEVRSQLLLGQARDQLLATSLTRQQAADRLGVGAQRISRLVDEGELVALEHGGQLQLPDWQFHPDSRRGRLDGLATVIEAYAGGPIALSQWMQRPNPALAGRTPIDALVAGDHDTVATAARARA